MSQAIKYDSGHNNINWTLGTVSPLLTAETTAIQVLFPAAGGVGETVPQQTPFLTGHTQASLGWNFTIGSLTNVTFRIYYYRYEANGNANPFQAVTWTQSAGAFTILPLTLVVAQSGRESYDFGIPACDGIKITYQGTGTATSSSLSEVHLAFRTN